MWRLVKRLFLANSYKKDVKRMEKQQKPLDTLGDAVRLLINDTPLPPQFLDHPLKGKWRGYRELHIAPDWLLIYHVENDTVYLDRTGSHAELFK